MPFIYAIRNRTTDLVYYGSTTTSLQLRLSLHRIRPSCSSRQITQCPTAYIELCEEVSEEEMLVRERWWIENNPCVNEQVPTQTKAEYYLKHKEEMLEKSKAYYQANRERLIQKAIENKRIRSLRRLLAREPPSVSQ
jgi:hypothetical protein